MNGKQQDVGTMKVRMRGLGKAIEFKFPNLRDKVRFNEEGIAEVPVWLGKKLLGPDFAGCGYEEVTVATEVTRLKREHKSEKMESKEKEFLEEIKD